MKRILCAVSVCVAGFGFSSNSFADLCTDHNSISGLVPGSYPCFETSVTFKYRTTHDNKDSSLSALYYKKGDNGGISRFHTGTETLDIWDTKFDFSATPSSSGWTGSMSITGHIGIDGLDTQKPQELMHASINGLLGQDGSLIGFNTYGIVCNPAIDTYLGDGGCTENEVVYFRLYDGVLDLSGKNQTFHGTAYTSVPLPAAVWLFGTGLLGLAGIARRGGSKAA